MAAKESSPSNISQVEVFSNEGGGSVNIANGVIELKYFESILQDSVRASVVFADSGGAVNDKTALDGLPIVGTENVSLKFEDLKENKLEFSKSKKNSYTSTKSLHSVMIPPSQWLLWSYHQKNT